MPIRAFPNTKLHLAAKFQEKKQNSLEICQNFTGEELSAGGEVTIIAPYWAAACFFFFFS